MFHGFIGIAIIGDCMLRTENSGL